MGSNQTALEAVFSAHAEVVPLLPLFGALGGGILRARGGSSLESWFLVRLVLYSPRTRR